MSTASATPNIERPSHLGDLRTQASGNVRYNTARTIRPEEAPGEPSTDNPFRPGDKVAASRGRQGTVKSVKGDGVEVDFGLGTGWLNYQELR